MLALVLKYLRFGIESEKAKNMENKGKIPENIIKQLEAVGQPISIPKGTTLMTPGSPVEMVIVPTKGSIRVFSSSENGRSISLFWVEPQETCIIGTSCLFNDSKYPAFACAETEIEALAVPVSQFREMFETNSQLQTFIFNLVSSRLMTVMKLVNDVAFNKVDSRLANFLLKRRNKENLITLTHDEIAQSLGTSREVVSRLLRNYANEGWLEQSHGNIVLRDIENIEKSHNL